MTPPPSPSDRSAGSRRSGNPAERARLAQARARADEEQRRADHLAARRERARRRRSRAAIWTLGIAGGLAVVAVVAASLVFAPRPNEPYQAGGTGAVIEGVETFRTATDHVEGTVDYPQDPPAGGPHNAVWLNCGVYTQPVPNENAVHALEHGAVWVTYDPAAVSAADIAVLASVMPATYAILSPYPGLPAPVAVSAWDHRLLLPSVDDPRLVAFFEEYWRSPASPEPTAPCTGGLDAAGRVS